MLATEIAKFPETAIKVFIDTLQAFVQPLSLPKITLANMITKWMVQHSNEPFTKKIMAKILIKLDDHFKSENVNFKSLARRLDLQSKPKEQHYLHALWYCLIYCSIDREAIRNIEELLTEKASTLFIFVY